MRILNFKPRADFSDKDGVTALAHARQRGYQEMVQLLNH